MINPSGEPDATPDETVQIQFFHEHSSHADYWWFRIEGQDEGKAFVIHGGNSPNQADALRTAVRALQLHLCP